MAYRLGFCSRASSFHLLDLDHKSAFVLPLERVLAVSTRRRRDRSTCVLKVRASDGRESQSYLDMWKNAVERKRKETEFNIIAENLASDYSRNDEDKRDDEIEKKSEEFKKIVEVPREERDRVQRMQVIDRAAAAIAAARAVLDESGSTKLSSLGDSNIESGDSNPDQQEGISSGRIFLPQSGISGNGIPGPDFWTWTPPMDSDGRLSAINDVQAARKFSESPTFSNPVLEKEQNAGFMEIPFESKLSVNKHIPLLPPLQSLVELEKVESSETTSLQDHDLSTQFSEHAAEAAGALVNLDNALTEGVDPDGSRWWKVTGVEQRLDGVICRWTLTRGVSADGAIEWQDKYWDAADEFGYKELGSEKSGRDAFGNIWREYWRESMWKDQGVAYLEKTADKWGKNGKGDEWQEKWWEKHDPSGQAEKWAHKWCSIDPNTYVEDGHAHIWHERWGENFDGCGSSTKYTDKWAERQEVDGGWTKWGDKWDENFDQNGHGVKQGETWWEGRHGERWNRTWGERHNDSGWVHKYGKSSSGEHWDTHVEQDTWYERYPHYGFYHCYANSVQLRNVPKPSEMGQDSEEMT